MIYFYWMSIDMCVRFDKERRMSEERQIGMYPYISFGIYTDT
jgi:hypothetical protein